MAKTSTEASSKKTEIFHPHCEALLALAGESTGYMRDFELCRICFRELASTGQIPGIKKSSW